MLKECCLSYVAFHASKQTTLYRMLQTVNLSIILNNDFSFQVESWIKNIHNMAT